MFDVTISSRETSEPFGGPFLQHAEHQIHGALAQLGAVVGELPLAPYDIFEESLLIDPAFVEGGGSEEHFEDEAAQGPVVDGSVVTSTENNLRREIEWRPAECISFVRHDFGKSKIHNHGIPIRIQQHVLRLEIPVNDVPPVHVRKSLQYPRGVKFGSDLRQSPVHLPPLYQIQQLAALHEAKEHVDARVVLEGIHEPANERMIEPGHDRPLPPRGRRLTLIEELALRLDLERVRRTAPRPRDHPHPPERPGAEEAMELHVPQRFRTGFRGRHGRLEAAAIGTGPVPASFASQAMQVQYHRFDIAQRELPALDRVAHGLDRFLPVLRPSLGTTELHIPVGQ
mmetsp:Transcript_29355/g.70866  ORF Transcript_29355/g.70866 Transcript_29355/m.70866 type:complete len:341 (+) Transcript_29355:369-1391(+)